MFFLLLQNGLVCPLLDVEDITEATLLVVENLISYGGAHQEDKLRIPKYLESYVRSRLPIFIRNAFVAMAMKQDREYILGDTAVHPVAYTSSGVIEVGKTWGEGLQQFLEMKHLRHLNAVQMLTNFMSNMTLLSRYQLLTGVSGTLGASGETRFLETVYGIHIMRMPPHKPSKRYEKNPVFTLSKEDWESAIEYNIEHELEQRAALVICEDIKTASSVRHMMERSGKYSIYLYTHDKEEDALRHTYGAGDVLLATNLAGRGTDIKVTEKVNQAGGLFVIIAYLPMSQRVQMQAFGRTARQGQPGSAMIIAQTTGADAYFTQVIEARNQHEDRRLEHMMTNEVELVKTKDRLFKKYCSFLESMYTEYKGRDIRDTIVSALNEAWGLWLQSNLEEIEDCEEAKLNKSLDTLLRESRQNVRSRKSAGGNVYHYIKYANEEKDHGKAIKSYDTAIEEDANSTAIAYYQRARRIILESGCNYKQRAKADLLQAIALLDQERNTLMATLQIIYTTHGKNTSHDNPLRDGFSMRILGINSLKDNINKSVSSLDALIASNEGATILLHPLFTLMDTTSVLAKNTMIEYEVHGLKTLYSVRRDEWMSPFQQSLVVTAIGMAVVLTGAILWHTGIGATTGFGLISEGVSDILDSIQCLMSGEFSLKDWGIKKAIGLAISVAIIGGGILILKFRNSSLLKSVIKPAAKNVSAMVSTTWASGKRALIQSASKIKIPAICRVSEVTQLMTPLTVFIETTKQHV